MGLDRAHANMTPEMLSANSEAQIAERFNRPDRAGASEFGPGLSRNRDDVAPLVNREHRRAAEAVRVPIEIRDGRPHPGRARARLSDSAALARYQGGG